MPGRDWLRQVVDERGRYQEVKKGSGGAEECKTIPKTVWPTRLLNLKLYARYDARGREEVIQARSLSYSAGVTMMLARP